MVLLVMFLLGGLFVSGLLVMSGSGGSRLLLVVGSGGGRAIVLSGGGFVTLETSSGRGPLGLVLLLAEAFIVVALQGEELLEVGLQSSKK